MRKDLQGLRHEKERLYGTLVTIFGSLIWLLIAGTLGFAMVKGGVAPLIVPVVEIAFFVGIYTLFKMFFRAYLFGHAIKLGPNQLPHLYESLAGGAKKLRMAEVPLAFVYNSNGLMNAFAMRVARQRLVLLTSALIDVESDPQVDFVIGHELGHHVAGHLGFWNNFLKFPGYVVPFLGAAYRRSRELTADRFGAFCVNDLEASRGALYMLACGSARLNGVLNANEFAGQEQLVPPVTGFLLHIFSGYPRLTRRVKEVERYFAGRR